MIFVPAAAMAPFMKTACEIILRRLMDNKSPQYMRLSMHFFCLFALQSSAEFVEQCLDSIQSGMLGTLVADVWSKVSATGMDTLQLRRLITGCTKLLCETKLILSPRHVGAMLRIIVSIIEVDEGADSAGWKTALSEGVLAAVAEEEEVSRDFDSTYSRLAYANIPDPEMSPQEAQAALYFARTISVASTRVPGLFLPAIQGSLDERQQEILKATTIRASVVIS